MEDMTMTEARKILTENKYTGVKCPCCSHFVKVYKRKLNSGMAKSLILIYTLTKRNDFNSIHVQNEFIKYGIKNPIGLEYDKLQYWDLIESIKGSNKSGASRTGQYKITPAGISFVENKSTVMEYVELFDARIYGFSGEFIGIIDAVNNKFDYHELMGTEPLHKLKGGTP